MGKVEPLKTHHRYTEKQVREGARNLLVNGANVTTGTEVLILNQPGLVDEAVADIIEQEARALGATVYIMWAGSVKGPEQLPGPVMAAMQNCEVTIFNHMLAGLLRLIPFEGSGLKLLNFCTTWDTLGSEFARVHYRVMMEIMQYFGPKLAAETSFRITCPLGTDYFGDIEAPPATAKKKSDTGDGFSLRTFPISVSPPIMSLAANGKLAIRWLTPAGIHEFDEPGISLPGPVLATIKNGRMVEFEGSDDAVAELQRFLEKIGGLTDKNGYIINSWHAGTNPRCFAHVTPEQNLEAWMYLIHGNPRIAHFHTVGTASPGEMSIPLVDPTIYYGDKKFWDAGKLVILDDPEVRERIAQYHDPDDALFRDTNIGL
jgi:hypothetical protein